MTIIHAAQLLMKHVQDLLPVGSLQDPLLGEMLDIAPDESTCSDSTQWWRPLDHHQHSWY